MYVIGIFCLLVKFCLENVPSSNFNIYMFANFILLLKLLTSAVNAVDEDGYINTNSIIKPVQNTITQTNFKEYLVLMRN